METQLRTPLTESFYESLLIAMEIIIDLPFGSFPINNSVSLSERNTENLSTKGVIVEGFQGLLLTRKKYFSLTYVTPVGTWTASSLPSPPSLLGYGNVTCVHLLPPHPRVHCDISASPLPSLTLTLTKHHLRRKKKPSLVSTTLIYAPSADDDDCFYYHSSRSNVVIAFGTLSSFVTYLQ